MARARTSRQKRDAAAPSTGVSSRARARQQRVKPTGEQKAQTGQKRERRGGFGQFVRECVAELRKVFERHGGALGGADPLDDLPRRRLDDDGQPVICFIVVFDVIPGSHAVHGSPQKPGEAEEDRRTGASLGTVSNVLPIGVLMGQKCEHVFSVFNHVQRSALILRDWEAS